MFNLFAPPDWPKINKSEMKKRARILVIDDLDFPYKALFERDEYNVDKWDDVENLPKIEEGYYDIILLDLQGVGREQTSEEGLGILKHIKSINPSQIIIAFSSADWPLKYQDFFDLADSTMPKSADYVDFKRKVDVFIEKRFSLKYYLDKINDEFKNGHEDLSELIPIAKESILRNSSDKLIKYLRKKSVDQEKIDRVLTVTNIAIGAFQICKSLT